jgi:hypothetical protein
MNEDTTVSERTPAEVFHAAQLIADEAIARDWSIWDFVDRVGTLKPDVDVLAFRLYASTVDAPDLVGTSRMNDHFAIDMERVFGISAEVWERTAALVKAHPDRVAPLNKFAIQWYGLDEDEEPTPSPSQSVVTDV